MNKLIHNISRTIIYILALGLMLACDNVYGQKYAFAHYDTGDGLIQSQVNNFYQDNSHRLWIATLGGVCRFDGSEYYAVSKANGLANNFVFVVYTDSKGTAWVGTNKGLSSIKNQTVYNYAVPADANKAFVSNVVEERDGAIWIIMSNHLYRVNGKNVGSANLPDSLNVPVSCITVDKTGSLYAAFMGKGVYKLTNGTWALFAPFYGAM
ncbi:MAG: two-component regulator propeller domain-containing protein, partial [Mucilaginibacter sp.]